jgi:hypothetical protein
MPLKGKAKKKTPLEELIEQLQSHSPWEPYDWIDRRCARCRKVKTFFPHAWCPACHKLIVVTLRKRLAAPAGCIGADITDAWEYYRPAVDRGFRDWAKGKSTGMAKHVRGSLNPPPKKPPFFN